MQGFYRINGEPIMFIKGIDTKFNYDPSKPETIKSATGFKILTDKHVSALAVKASIEQEYRRMTDFFKLKYFPVYLMARICYRIPVAGEELMSLHWDCLYEHNNTFYLKIGKRVRASENYLRGNSQYNIPQYIPNLYAYYWYPVSMDVAKSIVDYQVQTQIPEDHFLFDWSTPGNSKEEQLKRVVERTNMYIDEYLSQSDFGKKILETYGMDKFTYFSNDKRYLLLSVWQIARENLFWMNAGKMDLNSEELLFYLQGPVLTDIKDQDPILYGKILTTTEKALGAA